MMPASLHESLRHHLSCPQLLIFSHKDWGSAHPEHRTLIHQALPTLVPQSSYHTSISHCPGLGLIAAAPQALGVDVEVSARVEDKVVARISSGDELTQAPDAAALWCAKESCFKALRNFTQPSVISKISIGGWKKIDSQIETFQLLNFADFNSPSENRGVVVHFNDLTLSFFIFYS